MSDREYPSLEAEQDQQELTLRMMFRETEQVEHDLETLPVLSEYMDDVAALADSIAWQIAKDNGESFINSNTLNQAYEVAIEQIRRTR